MLLSVSESEIEPGYHRVLVRHMGMAEVWQHSSARACIGVIVKAFAGSPYRQCIGWVVFYEGGFCLPHDLVSLAEYEIVAFCAASSAKTSDEQS